MLMAFVDGYRSGLWLAGAVCGTGAGLFGGLMICALLIGIGRAIRGGK